MNLHYEQNAAMTLDITPFPCPMARKIERNLEGLLPGENV